MENISILEKGIYEFRLEKFNTTDRCISCHTAMEDSRMKMAEEPFATHPGDYLQNHPISEYGCTICHGGQGRAVNVEDAHGLNPDAHWPKPLLSQPYIQASCGKCHLAVFGQTKEFGGTETFRYGQRIFAREGCLGCHKARGVGGIIGPDLTEQGEKSRYEYDFQNISGEKSVSNWLKEHFRDPEMVSPGSKMLSIDLPDNDLEALATFVMGLSKPDIPLDYFSIDMLEELKGIREPLRGNQIFSYTCSSCHGKSGEGKDYKDYKTGVPAIMNPDFLRVASLDFVNFNILKGRSSKQMASWATVISGFTESELNATAKYVDSAVIQLWDINSILNRGGDPSEGGKIYSSNCGTCHGTDGKGGLAVALNQEDFLSRASDLFILTTLAEGRSNTAMPAWNNLEENEVSDLLAYLRSWFPGSVYPQKMVLPDGNSEEGEIQYHYNCSRCHGVQGEGNTGPSIINPDFMEAASDYFLYSTVAEGRVHTAMFGWSEDLNRKERLEVSDISNIIKFMREKASLPAEYIYAGTNPGNDRQGEVLFRNHCSECHGENGEGEIAPGLNNQEFLSAASNGYMLATITIGRKGTRMPSWGYENEAHSILSARDRQDIVAYIRSWQRIHIGF